MHPSHWIYSGCCMNALIALRDPMCKTMGGVGLRREQNNVLKTAHANSNCFAFIALKRVGCIPVGRGSSDPVWFLPLQRRGSAIRTNQTRWSPFKLFTFLDGCNLQPHSQMLLNAPRCTFHPAVTVELSLQHLHSFSIRSFVPLWTVDVHLSAIMYYWCKN